MALSFGWKKTHSRDGQKIHFSFVKEYCMLFCPIRHLKDIVGEAFLMIVTESA